MEKHAHWHWLKKTESTRVVGANSWAWEWIGPCRATIELATLADHLAPRPGFVSVIRWLELELKWKWKEVSHRER
jgi:hypothetical protein